MGKASLPKTGINDTLDANRERKKQFGRERAAATGITGTSLGTGGGGFNTTGNNTIQAPTLPTAGGTMIGPIAFYLKSTTITNGVINISKDNAYSSRVIVIGQGGAADDLEVILGASHAGQILFFQPIQAVTLQSYLKTATAWATSTSYSVGDVVLDSSQRYTCHVAHTSSSATDPGSGADWETKWYRNNIRITGATERVVAIDEIILLQYDSTDGVWTVVSGGNAATGGAGLGTANVWTDVNTFQSTVSMTGPTVNLGDSTNDRVNFISQVGTDINMGTYDVINLDRLKFATAAGAGNALGTSDTGIEAQFSGGSSAGVKLQVPANNIYQFFIGSTEKFNIGTSISALNMDLALSGYLAIGDNYMEFGDMTSANVGTTPANKRRVFSDSANNDELSVKKSDGSVVSLEGSGGGVSLGGTNTWTGVNTYNTYVKLDGNNRITGTQAGSGSTANRGIGFFTQTTTTGVGDYGSIGIPYYGGVVGNATDCDDKFGAAKGCIGLSLNSGSIPHLCIKVNTSGSSQWFKLSMNSGSTYTGFYV